LLFVTCSYVYMGGMPTSFSQNLGALALPSVTFERRYRGSIRNVLYGNCTCMTERVTIIDGVGVTHSPPESCDLRNPCQTGCVCISTDTESTCNCSQAQCVTGMFVQNCNSAVLCKCVKVCFLLLKTFVTNYSGRCASFTEFTENHRNEHVSQCKRF